MFEKYGFRKKEYERHPEAVANLYTMRGTKTTILLMTFVWILNVLNVFMVDQQTISKATVLSLCIFFIGVLVFFFIDLREIWVKYLMIFWVFSIVTVLTVFLTFHAYLICVLPIIYCSMHSSKKIVWWAYFLTVINIILTVFIGYENGLCDTNMVLLSGEPLAEYLGENGEFLLTEVNDRTYWTLPLFFILPRCIICYALTVVCSKVSAIIRNNMKYMQELEAMAEIDEMTGVFNRNKYLSMTSEGYKKEDKLAVIFWDINYLKQVNDTLGHEQGDVLIKSIAEVIKKVSTQFEHAYRIGGDEFVMIMRGGDEISVKKKIKEWEEEMKKFQNIESFPISASYGYAYGKGNELEGIIQRADKMMYDNKRKFHEENKG